MFSHIFHTSGAKNTVNTDVFGALEVQNHGILLCFFAPDSQNHGIYSVFGLDLGKNTGIYAVFSMLQENVFHAKGTTAPAALASLLFDPPEPQIIGKNTVNRDFPTFSRACIFFLL